MIISGARTSTPPRSSACSRTTPRSGTWRSWACRTRSGRVGAGGGGAGGRHAPDGAEIVDFVRGRLAGFKKPRFVRFVEALPATSATGKVQKAQLRKQYAGLATGPGPV